MNVIFWLSRVSTRSLFYGINNLIPLRKFCGAWLSFAAYLSHAIKHCSFWWGRKHSFSLSMGFLGRKPTILMWCIYIAYLFSYNFLRYKTFFKRFRIRWRFVFLNAIDLLKWNEILLNMFKISIMNNVTIFLVPINVLNNGWREWNFFWIYYMDKWILTFGAIFLIS